MQLLLMSQPKPQIFSTPFQLQLLYEYNQVFLVMTVLKSILKSHIIFLFTLRKTGPRAFSIILITKSEQ